MKNLTTIKSYAVAAMVIGTLSFGTLTSCGNKSTEKATEETIMEEPAAEHPTDGAEHPTDGAEHPAADTTATDTTSVK